MYFIKGGTHAIGAFTIDSAGYQNTNGGIVEYQITVMTANNQCQTYALLTKSKKKKFLVAMEVIHQALDI